jgi:hypothetical protein
MGFPRLEWHRLTRQFDQLKHVAERLPLIFPPSSTALKIIDDPMSSPPPLPQIARDSLKLLDRVAGWCR